MLSMERIPDQIGYLVLTEDGAVLTVRNYHYKTQVIEGMKKIEIKSYSLKNFQSGGELENDERVANIVIGLVSLVNKDNSKAFFSDDFEKISITYDDHCYIICLSNKKIHVVKKRLDPPSSGLSTDGQLVEI